MMTLKMRSYAGETDLQAIADLINTCEAVDRLDEGTSVQELRMEFDTPSVDKARDLCLWQEAEGKLIGFGQLWIPESGETIDGFLWFRVHPTARGGDVEKSIVAWGEERMREVAKERGVRVKLRSHSRANKDELIAFLKGSGFTEDRYFFRMARSLIEPIPELQLPAGFRLHRGAQRNAIAWAQLFNQTFIDHWNHYDVTIEKVEYEVTDPDYRPELDLVAVAPDGKFVSFCYCKISPENNARTGRNEGWIADLGTRRGFRRMGLGRAILLAGLHALKAAGVETALLGVDTQNPSGAMQLYESVGFYKVHTNILYVKDVLL